MLIDSILGASRMLKEPLRTNWTTGPERKNLESKNKKLERQLLRPRQTQPLLRKLLKKKLPSRRDKDKKLEEFSAVLRTFSHKTCTQKPWRTNHHHPWPMRVWSKRETIRTVPQTSATTLIPVSTGMDQREEESSESTEKILIPATSLEILSAPRKNLVNCIQNERFEIEEAKFVLVVTIALTLI